MSATWYTANIAVQNNTGANAVIILSHMHWECQPEIGGPWTVAPGQTTPSLTVNFDTGLFTGPDFWYVRASVMDGQAPGIYSTVGTIQNPALECELQSEDINQNMVFTVTIGNLDINLKSGGCPNKPLYYQGNYYPKINHVFVLMMENHSFDHIFGFSGLQGTDAVTGQSTSINGLTEAAGAPGIYSNTYPDNGTNYPVTDNADYSMPIDPGHEFVDTYQQLGGEKATYPSPNPAPNTGNYPPIDTSGFVYNYANSKSPYEGGATSNLGEIMKCYDTKNQLPVIYSLAQNFAICDNWFSSLPGPTWPNRFFVHGASSDGLDHSPSSTQIAAWESLDGFSFPNGSIFQRMLSTPYSTGYRLYNDTDGPYTAGGVAIVSALEGITLGEVNPVWELGPDLNQIGEYNWNYTFIEPNYGDVSGNTYEGGSSQHPMDDITKGEALIKQVYEAIRQSPIWESSMLIITYDEHGGFYDHAIPPPAPAPGDKSSSSYNQYGFTFQQYGVRVPAVVVSPWIPAGTIDHTLYDHASIPATLEKLFHMPALTERDGRANNLSHLASLSQPRTDCIVTLPSPADPGTKVRTPLTAAQKMAFKKEPLPKEGNLVGLVQIALKTDLELSIPTLHPAIIARVKAIRTRGEAERYIEEVVGKSRKAGKRARYRQKV